MKNTVIIILCGMFLSFCVINVADIFIHRAKTIQGDYYIEPNDIDGRYLYGIFCKGEVPNGYEAVNLIGVDGEYIYWTTFGKTKYRIDTSKKEQILIDKIPDEVKLMPVIEFYNALN